MFTLTRSSQFISQNLNDLRLETVRLSEREGAESSSAIRSFYDRLLSSHSRLQFLPGGYGNVKLNVAL